MAKESDNGAPVDDGWTSIVTGYKSQHKGHSPQHLLAVWNSIVCMVAGNKKFPRIALAKDKHKVHFGGPEDRRFTANNDKVHRGMSSKQSVIDT